MNKIFLIIIYTAALHFCSSYVYVEQNKLIPFSIPDNRSLKKALGYLEDSYLNFTELAIKNGYTTEQHSVTTEDGYILTVHRILSKCPQTHKYPVVLMHGVVYSSDAWIFSNPKENIGYILSSNCYDVWAANHRGNTYSRKHKRLNPDRDPEYWEYSFDEHGIYDLPAIIDYVLSVTNRSKVYYIGHSQGTTDYFVMGSMKPEYNNKIQLSVNLAPVAWLRNINPLLKLVAKTNNTISDILKSIGIRELFARHQLIHKTTEFLCQNKPIGMMQRKDLCDLLMFPFTGVIGRFSLSQLSIAAGHIHAGISVKSLNHYLQLISSGKFQRYDEGQPGNLLKYAANNPPEYNISQITSPIVLIGAQSDIISDLKDVEILSTKLPNLIETYVVPDPGWNHNDYLWNENSAKYVSPKILEHFNTFNNL